MPTITKSKINPKDPAFLLMKQDMLNDAKDIFNSRLEDLEGKKWKDFAAEFLEFNKQYPYPKYPRTHDEFLCIGKGVVNLIKAHYKHDRDVASGKPTTITPVELTEEENTVSKLCSDFKLPPVKLRNDLNSSLERREKKEEGSKSATDMVNLTAATLTEDAWDQAADQFLALKESEKSKKITLTKADQASLEPAVLSLLQMFLDDKTTSETYQNKADKLADAFSVKHKFKEMEGLKGFPLKKPNIFISRMSSNLRDTMATILNADISSPANNVNKAANVVDEVKVLQKFVTDIQGLKQEQLAIIKDKPEKLRDVNELFELVHKNQVLNDAIAIFDSYISYVDMAAPGGLLHKSSGGFMRAEDAFAAADSVAANRAYIDRRTDSAAFRNSEAIERCYRAWAAAPYGGSNAAKTANAKNSLDEDKAAVKHEYNIKATNAGFVHTPTFAELRLARDALKYDHELIAAQNVLGYIETAEATVKAVIAAYNEGIAAGTSKLKRLANGQSYDELMKALDGRKGAMATVWNDNNKNIEKIKDFFSKYGKLHQGLQKDFEVSLEKYKSWDRKANELHQHQLGHRYYQFKKDRGNDPLLKSEDDVIEKLNAIMVQITSKGASGTNPNLIDLMKSAGLVVGFNAAIRDAENEKVVTKDKQAALALINSLALNPTRYNMSSDFGVHTKQTLASSTSLSTLEKELKQELNNKRIPLEEYTSLAQRYKALEKVKKVSVEQILDVYKDHMNVWLQNSPLADDTQVFAAGITHPGHASLLEELNGDMQEVLASGDNAHLRLLTFKVTGLCAVMNASAITTSDMPVITSARRKEEALLVKEEALIAAGASLEELIAAGASLEERLKCYIVVPKELPSAFWDRQQRALKKRQAPTPPTP